MKRISFIIILLSLACVTAQAQGTSRGYTSTQTIGSGSGTSSFDALLKEAAAKSNTKTWVSTTTPKEKAYVPTPRPTKSKTVKDDRQVVVTKEAFDTEKLFVKPLPTGKVVAPSNIEKAPLSRTQRGSPIVARTEFSPVPKAQ